MARHVTLAKWLRRLALALAIVLTLVLASAWWLLGTTSGLHFALARAQALAPGVLSVERAQGRLAGPLDLAGIRYDDGRGTRVSVANVHLDWRPWALLARRVHVRELRVTGVALALPQSPPEPDEPTKLSLQPPIDMVLDRAQVRALDVTRDGQPLFTARTLDLRGSWTTAGLALQQLNLQAPAGHVRLDGPLTLGPAYRGTGTAAFAWQAAGIDYAGAMTAHGDGQRTALALTLTQPMALRLRLDVAQAGNHAWTASLDAPRFDPTPWLGAGTITSTAAALRGHGDAHGGTLDGQLDINDYPLLLAPLRAQFNADFSALSVPQLELTSPRIAGKLTASGHLQLDAQPLRGEAKVQWADVVLPATLAGQTLASHGQLAVTGNAASYKAAGDMAIGPPDQLTQLTLALDGNAQAVTLHALDLRQQHGSLHAAGVLTLAPVLAWQATVNASAFDPGQLFANWRGALDLDLASSGSLPSAGPDITLELRQLGGKLHGRAVAGAGKLHWSPQRVLDGQLKLASGRSTVQADAQTGTSNAINLTLAVASLGDWLPKATGRLDGHFKLHGKLPKLGIDGQLHGQALAWQGQRVDALHLIVGLPDISQLAGKIDLQLRDVHAQGLAFQRIHALAEGSPRRHQFTLDALGSQLSGQLAIHGTHQASGAWNGTLSTLALAPQGLPPWRLLQPASLSYNAGTLRLAEACLSAGDPQLCIAAKRDRVGNLDASYRLHALPLAMLMDAAGQTGLPLRADGTLEGHGQLRRNAAGALSGMATITSLHGVIAHTGQPDMPLLAYDNLQLDADLAPARQRFSVHAGLDHDGRLDGQATIAGAQQVLAGQLDVRLASLAFVELLGNDVANVKGALAGHFQLAGTLAQPVVTGQARVSELAAEIPAAGLKLNHGALTLSAADTRHLRVDGTVASGPGQLTIAGNIGLGADARSAITLNGKQFTAADIPAAKLVVSPDVLLTHDADGLDVSGSVFVDSADINADKLPGAGAIQASPDVVVVDQREREQAARKLPISARVKVDLGRRTHLAGMGVDGMLSGVLTVIERPGRATLGQGQIDVNGTYRAYGQNLHIQRGQLLFASTPIDNPGLNIRAVRKLNPNATIDEGQEVGLLVSGTAQRPVLTVFSNPLMEQSDALSYLVTGKPLSQVKGGEGDMVGAAAQALGSAAGDLLARSVGSRIGVDDIGVASNEALGGGSAFTVGKYLSPRLYLSYGVGLFEPGEVITLRYRLSQRWNFEAQQATDFSRASFNYRIEK